MASLHHLALAGMPRLLAAIAVVALLAGGCGDGAKEPSSTAERAGPASPPAAANSPTTAAPSPGAGQAAVPELLRFTAAGVDGGQVDGSAFAGRDVALWFWAPW